MTASFTMSLVCPALIGRGSQLEKLLHLMQQGCAGQGQTVLVTGEAGIGKSRLVTEALKRLSSARLQAVSLLR
jgi:predicted ATPase